MNTRTILGGGLLLTVCGAAAMLGGSVVAFFHLAGLLLVLGVTVAGTLIAVPTANLSAALSAWLANEDLDEAGAQRGHRVFSQMANMASAAGGLGVLIGLVQMLQNLEDPTRIGPAMAMSLLSLSYGVFFGELILRSIAEDCVSRDLQGPAVN